MRSPQFSLVTLTRTEPRFYALNGKILQDVAFPETFGRHFPNFEDIDFGPEENFSGLSQGLEWYVELNNTTTLKRDEIFESATSFVIPTFQRHL